MEFSRGPAALPETTAGAHCTGMQPNDKAAFAALLHRMSFPLMRFGGGNGLQSGRQMGCPAGKKAPIVTRVTGTGSRPGLVSRAESPRPVLRCRGAPRIWHRAPSPVLPASARAVVERSCRARRSFSDSQESLHAHLLPALALVTALLTTTSVLSTRAQERPQRLRSVLGSQLLCVAAGRDPASVSLRSPQRRRPVPPLEPDRGRRQRPRPHAGAAGRGPRVRRAAGARPLRPRHGHRPHRHLRRRGLHPRRLPQLHEHPRAQSGASVTPPSPPAAPDTLSAMFPSQRRAFARLLAEDLTDAPRSPAAEAARHPGRAPRRGRHPGPAAKRRLQPPRAAGGHRVHSVAWSPASGGRTPSARSPSPSAPVGAR